MCIMYKYTVHELLPKCERCVHWVNVEKPCRQLTNRLSNGSLCICILCGIQPNYLKDKCTTLFIVSGMITFAILGNGVGNWQSLAWS